MKLLLQIVLFATPWKIRRLLMQRLWGYSIAPSAKIGYSLILSKRLIMGENSVIRSGNVIKQIDLLRLDSGACIARCNLVSGVRGFETESKCRLILRENATITSRHFIDCSGGVEVGEYTTIAGNNSEILSHSIDPYLNREVVHPVTVGKYCFVGTRCLFLPGSSLPDYSILGGGAVVSKKLQNAGCLYVGSPAIMKKKLNIGDVAYFNRKERFVD